MAKMALACEISGCGESNKRKCAGVSMAYYLAYVAYHGSWRNGYAAAKWQWQWRRNQWRIS
jgi:hypothetical protein